jgi:YbgC/YbaW family acyl-CoA thioester hydrolase
MKFETEVLIKESHLDTFGHVNNAAYLTIFEEVRWEFITRNGYGLKEVHESQKAPIILEVNIKFKREVKLRENVRITMEVTKSGKIGEVTQEIYNSKGELCTVAVFAMGFFDLQKRTLIAPTPEWNRAIGVES